MITGATSGRGGIALAKHLASEKNEDVIMGQSRGLVENDIFKQVMEITKFASDARAKKPLYHLHVDPSISYTDAQYDSYFKKFEAEFGLENQAFCEVSHIKAGREHRHRVYSLVKPDGTCIQLSNDYKRREKLSRLMEMETGEKLTQGRHNRAVMHALRNEGHLKESHWIADEGLTDGPPALANQSPTQRHIAERTGLDADAIGMKALDAWKRSDSPLAFSQALLDRGLTLAMGTKVTVIIDQDGNTLPIGRLLGKASKENGNRIPAKDVQDRIDGLDLMPADLVRSEIRKVKFIADLKVKNPHKEKIEFDSFKDDSSYKFKKYEFDEAKIEAQLRNKIKASPIKTKDFSKMSKEQAIAEQAKIIAEIVMSLIAMLFGKTYITEEQYESERRIQQLLEQRRHSWNDKKDSGQELERTAIEEFKRQIELVSNSASILSNPSEHRGIEATLGTFGTEGTSEKSDRRFDGVNQPIDSKSNKLGNQDRYDFAEKRIAEIQFNKGLNAHQQTIKDMMKSLTDSSQIQKICLRNLAEDKKNIDAMMVRWKNKKGKWIIPKNPKTLSDEMIKDILLESERKYLDEINQEIARYIKACAKQEKKVTWWEKLKGSKSQEINRLNEYSDKLQNFQTDKFNKVQEIKHRTPDSLIRDIQIRRNLMENDFNNFLSDTPIERKLDRLNANLKKAVFNQDIIVIKLLLDNDIEKAREYLENQTRLREAQKIDIIPKIREAIKIDKKPTFKPEIVQPIYEDEQESRIGMRF